MIIDFHSHAYCEEYLKELRRADAKRKAVSVLPPQWEGADARISRMQELKVDREVLFFTPPDVDDSEFDLSLSQIGNDFLADLCRKYPDSFSAFASLPSTKIQYAVDELNRAIEKLNMDGISIGTNIAGKPLDSEEFAPLFEEANKRKSPIFVHPSAPRYGMMEDYKLDINLGFFFETTLAVARLLFGGVFEKYEQIKFIFSHMGGTIPFIQNKWDMGFKTWPETRQKISELPSEYLKRLYYDTARSTDVGSLLCTYNFVGADHIVFGADIPYASDRFIEICIETIEKLGLQTNEKQKIFFKNAQHIIGKDS